MFKKMNLFILIIFVLLSVFITQPSNYMLDTFKEGQVSDKTVYAPRYVKYKDTILYKQLRDEAVAKVSKKYELNDGIYEKVDDNVKKFIDSMKEQNKYIHSELAKKKTSTIKNPLFNEEEFINNELNKVDNPFKFTTKQLKLFYGLSEAQLDVMSTVYRDELKTVYANQIGENDVEPAQQNFARRIKLSKTLLLGTPSTVIDLLTETLKQRIVTNLIYNKEATDEAIQEAIDSVDTYTREIQKGETVVRDGDIITPSHIEKLSNLGLIKTEVNYKDMFNVLPYNLCLFIILHLYLFKFHFYRFQKLKQYVFLLSSIVFSMLLTNVIKDSSFFLIPVLTVLMLFVVFWGRKMTLFISLILGMLINVGDYEYLLLVIFSGVFLSILFKERGNRIDLIVTGIILGGVLAAIYFIYSTVIDSNFSVEKIFFIIASAFVSSLLTMGFIPLFESVLGLVTSLKLHELYNPNHPLLKRLIREAPGTYHHSLMVGNLAETAADEIGADGLLLRVGAFFHDTGKLRNPEFFIENTTPNRNPHDNIDPLESAKIIKRHPIDSVEMCKKYNVPEPILKLIISHHGDSLVKYFYNRAKEENSNVSEEDYRYSTPTPKTREEGILLLADTIEAYSRTIISKPKAEFEMLIKNMIYSKIQDGTLRNCDLSLKDIDVIVYTFTNYLLNSNHERISY
ncbi:hypothetical protein CN918_25300 [Priestia megaterium]|nr:hypothetical protein CN918_25300 [Priestia megaterium]